MKKLLFVFIVLFGLSRLVPTFIPNTESTSKANTVVDTSEEVHAEPSFSTQDFKCDGRQYCSQMTSREEAEFFTNYCPNTKMDGDGDGIPCENDSRW